jgi:hypothetical protein
MGRPAIELEELHDNELKLCLTLLRASLHKKGEANLLIREIESFLFRDIPQGWKTGARNEALRNNLAHALSERAARKRWKGEVSTELAAVQARWRSRCNGPQAQMMGPAARDSFDSWTLTNEYSIPSFTFQKRYGGSRRTRRPFLAISISSATELFELFLLRAIANGQLSQFAHCVVCGGWELKKRAGRRSNAVLKHSARHPEVWKWSKFWRLLPRWPAYCANPMCKTRFTNTVSGFSAFQLQHFPGLLGDGLAQGVLSG